MKTHLPILTTVSKVGTPRCGVRAGLTILEMLVSTAMLSFIIIGLTAVFIQTQKAFKTSIKQNTVTDAGRSIMDMIAGDVRQMSDANNTNSFVLGNQNFNPNYNCYLVVSSNSLGVFTNSLGDTIYNVELDSIFLLEHTNTTWVGVGYAISNYPNVSMGALYRYETNWTSLNPVFANDLFSAFYANFANSNFVSTNWHRVADGVVDLQLVPFDQNGLSYSPAYIAQNGLWYLAFPRYPSFSSYPETNALPNSMNLELGILEPDTLVQARGLAASPIALNNFLSSNTLPHMEIFRQHITIAAASR